MTEQFDSGTVYLCTLNDVSRPGEMAAETLAKVARHYFKEERISYRRQYAAKGANEQVDMVIRIVYEPKARIGMFAVLGNGDQYQIDSVSQIRDPDSRRKYSELTLSRLENYYDVLESE